MTSRKAFDFSAVLAALAMLACGLMFAYALMAQQP